MKFFSCQLTTLVLFALYGSAQACKCLSSVGNNVDATRACCKEAGGSFSGSDCSAGSMSENLSGFASCCRFYGDRSDCRCPIGCGFDKSLSRIYRGTEFLLQED